MVKDKATILKEEICNSLNNRKKQERAILGLFFKEEDGKFYTGKFQTMYNTIVNNLKAMDDNKLNEVYNSVCDTTNKLKNDSSKDVASMLKRTQLMDKK
jgi:hypothetical protein